MRHSQLIAAALMGMLVADVQTRPNVVEIKTYDEPPPKPRRMKPIVMQKREVSEVGAWNAEVERRKFEKRERKALRRAQQSAGLTEIRA